MKTQVLGLKRKLTYIAVASCFTVTPVFGNPAGGVVTHGGATFSVQGNTLTINNMPNSIINWNQFSIGAGEITRFIQQSGQSAVLNRVVGQDPSAILGQLLSNGRVFIINPNGVLFGAGSRVDVAGLVVSTLNMTDQDFINGRLKFAGGDNAGNIVNQGQLTSSTGGQIYLVAPKIENSGIITSPQGEIILAAGHSINLVDAANPEIQVSITAPATETVNVGQIVAQSGKVGLYASLISQKGIISADRAIRGVNGEIILKAGNTLNLEAGSVTSAQGGGQVKAFANMQDGQVNVAGKLDASAPSSGNGGFIETSAAHVNVSNTANVTTLAANGRTGTWLIDPIDFSINAGPALQSNSGIGADTLSNNLNTTGVSISTDPASGGSGDIFVNAPVIWSSDNKLTLTAAHDIKINADINNSGAGDLELNAGRMVTVQPVDPNQSVSVEVGHDIVVNAAGLTIQGGTASCNGECARSANATFHASRDMLLTLGAGGLTVLGGNATANAFGSGATATANAQVSASTITINSTGPIAVRGGSANALVPFGRYTATASANADITAVNNITIHGSVAVTGGSASARASSSAFARGSADAGISANNISLNGSVTITGGLATATASSSAFAGASADANIRANNNITVNTTGLITVAGGNAAASINTFESSGAFASATATASMSAGADIVITSGSISVQGGHAAGSDSVSADAFISAGNQALITTTGTVKINSGTALSNNSIHADGYIESTSSTTPLIDITFTNLNCCGVFVNGVAGDSVGAETDGKTGFFAGSTNFGFAAAMIDTALLAAPINNGSGTMPAIYGTNYFVHYLATAPSSDLLLYENGAVNPNGVGEPLWTFLGNSLELWNDPKDEFNKQECGTHV